ncbi:MAG TPA: hypothetical protein VMU14_05860, partial [Acidimicrobiales bacterium]|nr:hypothetical protein [Acidimicrobiales bacterium]
MLCGPDGSQQPVPVRSIVGLIPLFAVTTLQPEVIDRLPGFRARTEWFERHRPQYAAACAHSRDPGYEDRRLLSVLSPDRLVRVLARMADEAEFLSPYGVRALSKWHADHPVSLDIDGMRATVDYEPGESTTALFGGNSNWRGPVWFPINHLIIGGLTRFHSFLGPAFTVEYPTGSGRKATLIEIADDLARRLTALFLPDASGYRPVYGRFTRYVTDPAWRGLVPFHEYFHGDTGAGLGASHQTGWTALIIDELLGLPVSPRR